MGCIVNTSGWDIEVSIPELPKKNKKQEKDMFDEKQYQLNHLHSRAQEIFWEKDKVLVKTFNVHDDPMPETFEDLYERITQGRFIINEEAKRKGTYGGPLRYVQWRDPAKIRDKAGYDAAKEKLDEAFQDLMDVFPAGDYNASLEALKEFKAKVL